MGGGGSQSAQSGWGNPQGQAGGPTLGGWSNPQSQAGGPPALGGWNNPQDGQLSDPFSQGQRPFSNQPVDFLRALRMGGMSPNDQQIDTTDFMSRYPQFRNANGGFASFQ